MDNSTIIISDYINRYSSLNGTRRTRISKIDIARGILSIGKTHWTQYLKSSGRVINDFLHHWTGLRPFINENPNLTINSNYVQLDLSEKILKSYNIGMGVAKIVAERILNIPYLQHVDSLVNQGTITLTSGSNERGDMVGLDKNRDWHVMEAKGRTSEPSNTDRNKAKTQAQKITSIRGTAPATKSYCITYINEFDNQIFLNDPDDKPIVPVTIEVEIDNFIKLYYDKIFKDIYSRQQDMTLNFNEQNISFSLFRANDQSQNIYIGLENRILTDLRNGNISFSETLLPQNQVFNLFSQLGIDNISIGNDGIVLFDDVSNLIENNKAAANMVLLKGGLKFLN